MRVSGVDSNRALTKLNGFAGLNNVTDPMRGRPGRQGVAPQSWELLQVADNVDLTNSGGAVVRDGYRPFAACTHITGSFVTFDFTRFYIIDADTLLRVNDDGSTVELATGVTGDAYWTQLNDVVYLSCDAKLELHPGDVVREWGVPTPAPTGRLAAVSGSLGAGEYRVCFTFIDAHGREGGASPYLGIVVANEGGIAINDIPSHPGCATAVYVAASTTGFYLLGVTRDTVMTYAGGALGRELTTQFLDPIPQGTSHVAVLKGQLYAAQYIPEQDMTAVWSSEPMGYHLFNHNSGFFLLPGKVEQMAATDETLMLSTGTRTFLYNQDTLTKVADYGSVPGQHAAFGPDGKLYFWTKRGLCRVSPFENLTESDVSVAPGISAAGGVIQRHGYTQYVVMLKSGGAAFNKR